MKKINLLILFFFFLLKNFLLADTPKGIIKGKVFNADTKEPLIGANVLVMKTNFGAMTDLNGEFSVKNIPVGNYNLEFSFIGFGKVIKTEILVKPEKITFLNVELKESIIEKEAVTVNAGYFRNVDASSIGLTNFNVEEVKRAPGSAGDISRLLLVLPSTAKVSDNQNDLAVRGGSPTENGFFVDGIQIPNINHFPPVGSTGGPIGLLNIDFINGVNYYTSGFSAAYPDRLSSIIDIQFREGNKEQFYNKAYFNFTGFGGVTEGNFCKQRGTYLFSANKSYLDLFVDAIGIGIAPRYGDVQGKVTYNLSDIHKISLLNIYGESLVDISKQKAIEHGHNDYYGRNKNKQFTSGVTLQSIWSQNLFSNLYASYSFLKKDQNFSKVVSDEKAIDSKLTENYFNLRNINYLQIGKNNKIEFGADFNLNNGTYDYSRYADTNRFGAVDPTFVINNKISPYRTGGFLTFIFSPLQYFTVSAGSRLDYYSVNEEINISPRINLSYDITDITKLSLSGGILYQQLPMFVTSQRPEFEKLKNTSVVHYGLSIEHLLSEDTKLTLEFYNKEYSNLPLEPADPYLSVIDGGLFNNRFKDYKSLETSGKAFTRGIELMIQKKLAADFYGMISGSYFRSKYQDYTGTWRNRIYDNQFLFSVIGGYKPNDEWEFGVRWTYAGGVPFTPYDEVKSAQFGVGIIDQNKINSERLPDYHTLNLRVDKKFYFANTSLDIYLNILNAYNRKNVAVQNWNRQTNSLDTMYQWSLMPILGIEYEF